MNIEVSIIIPTRDRSTLLPRAIRSIKKQSFKHWECIIIDDGSTDNTQEVFYHETFNDKRFKYFKQKALGIASARNHGISKAKGKYLAFLDSDDEYLPDGIEKLYHEISMHTRAKLVYADYLVFEENSNILRKYYTFSPPSKPELYQCFIVPRNNPILPSACIVDRNAFTKTGTLDEYFITSEMVEFWGRFVEKFDIHYLNDFTTIYHRHDEQITRFLIKRRFYYDELAYRATKRLTIDKLFPKEKFKDQEKAIEDFAKTLYRSKFPTLKTCKFLYEMIQKKRPNKKSEKMLKFLNKNFDKIISEKYPNEP